MVGLGVHRRRLTSYAYWGLRWLATMRCKTCQSLPELDNQDAVFFLLLAVTMIVIELDHIVLSGEPYLRTRE